MTDEILLGPILGLESETTYSVLVLVKAGNSPIRLNLIANGKALPPVSFRKVGKPAIGECYRAVFDIAAGNKAAAVEYRILGSNDMPLANVFGSASWSFYVPKQKNEIPKIAFASCNGFSDGRLARNTKEPYRLWQHLDTTQQQALESFKLGTLKNPDNVPCSLLLMGGDQVYADEIFESKRTEIVTAWALSNEDEQLAWPDKPGATATSRQKRLDAVRAELDLFYCDLYQRMWNRDKAMTNALATIPSVMMWDDHDIFDGWGSHPEKLQQSRMYQEIFRAAAKYFDLFQLRHEHHARLDSKRSHRCLGFSFRNHHILALDGRSERTRNQIHSAEAWLDIKRWLADIAAKPKACLLVMAALPLVYRRFYDSVVEGLVKQSWAGDELDDDVLDHWSVRLHQGEQLKMIENLLATQRSKQHQVIILSGDVHIGCAAQIVDKTNGGLLHQIVSSAIVHPAPNFLQWLAVRAVTEDGEQIFRPGDGREVIARMIEPVGAGDRYIRQRNYLTLHGGTDGKLWANWYCEDILKENNNSPSITI